MRSKRKEGATCRVEEGRTEREVGKGTQRGKQFKCSVLVISFLDTRSDYPPSLTKGAGRVKLPRSNVDVMDYYTI